METTFATQNILFDKKAVAMHAVPGTNLCEFHVDDCAFDFDTLAKNKIFPQSSLKLLYDGKPLMIFYQDEVIYCS